MYVGDISEQLRVFFYSLGFGFAVGLCYGLSGLIRAIVLKGKKTKWLFLADVLFFCFASMVTFSFLLAVNRGRFRFYVFFALLAGFCVYYFTLNSFFRAFGMWVVKNFSSVFRLSARIISAPFTVFWLIGSKAESVFLKKCKKNFKKRKK